MGMATAASVGTIQVVFGRGLQRSMNWSVGSFLFISILGWYVWWTDMQGDVSSVASSGAGTHAFHYGTV